MATQNATTGQLENAQRIAIAQTRFTMEHNAPMLGLVEKMTLKNGEKSITVPKVGQMTASSLTDGVDLTDTSDIGMTTVSLTSAEVGLKVILTDKLVRQENEDVFRMVGTQMGDAMARKKDRDLLGLFSALNGGSDLGATGRDLEWPNLLVAIGHARANKFPKPISIVHHPWALFRHVVSGTMGIAGGATQGAGISNSIPLGPQADMLKDFWRFRYDQVDVYDDGNIDEDSSGDGIGAVFSKNAMVYLESVGFNTEQERDASLRATEIVVSADFGVFELDDTYGAPMTFVVSAQSTD